MKFLVLHQGEGQVVILGKLPRCGEIFIHVDAYDLQARLVVALPQLRQVGHFLAAGFTPGGPEGQVHHVTPIVRK